WEKEAKAHEVFERDGKSASTPTDTEKPLLKDSDGKDVDVHTYRSMIGSLMYLTSSRPDIMFAWLIRIVIMLVQAWIESLQQGDGNSLDADLSLGNARSKQLFPLHPLRLNSVGLSAAFTKLIVGLDKMEESRLKQEGEEQHCILTPPCSYQISESLEGCLDDEPMWAADCVFALTLGSAINIREAANEFAIKGSEILHSIKGTILEEILFAEFDEFMPMTTDENSKSESATKEPPFEKITFNTIYKVKTSLEEPPIDLALKPRLENLVVDGVVQAITPTTAEQRLAKKNELKASGTLLMALPDKHQLKFNIHKDAKSLMEAIEKSSKSLDQIHDMLQKLISKLEILGESLSQEDINLKFLRSLPSEWRTHTLIWRNKANLEDQSLDNFLNNLKSIKLSTNESVSVVPSVSAASTKAPVSALPNVDNISDVVIYSFFTNKAILLENAGHLGTPKIKTLKEELFQWRLLLPMLWCHIVMELVAMIGAFRHEEPTNYALMAFTSSNLSSSDNEVASCSKACSKAYATLQSHYDKLTVDFKKSQFDVLSYKSGLESVEARLVVYQQNENMFEEDIKLLKLDVMLRDNALVELKKKFEKAKKERDEFKQALEKFQTSSKNLIFHDASTSSETVPNVFHVEPSTTKPNKDMYQSNRPFDPIIKDWVSDSEDESKENDFYEKQMVQKPVRNHAMRVNHQNYARMTHPYSNKHVVPTTVLTRSRLVPLNAARPVTNPVPQTTMKNQRPANHVVNKPHSPIRRPINHTPAPKNSNFHKKVTTVKTKKVNDVQGTKGNWAWKPKCTVLDHVSRLTSASMTLKQFDNTDALGKSKVPRENNMCNVALKNIVPLGYLNCLLAKGSRPKWLFDIDTLIQSMNYQPVVVGNQPNHNAGIQGNFDACKVVKEAKSAQEYVLLPLWSTVSKDPQNSDADAAVDVKDNEPKVHVSPSSSDKPKKYDEKAKREAKGKSHVDLSTRVKDLRNEFKEVFVNSTNRVNAASVPVSAVGLNSTNNTNSFNAVGPSNNDVSSKFEIGGKSSFMDPSQYPDDPDMPALEDIVYLDDTEDVDPQTKIMERMVKERGGLNQINADDFHTCMFACFISQEEPKRVHQALKDSSWIESMQEELPQFKMQKVWVLLDLPKGLQGGQSTLKLHQAPRAWYETLANYLLENGFQRGKIDQTLFIKKQQGDILLFQSYVDDIIFGSTNKELCQAFEKLIKDKFQMSSIGELTLFVGLQVKQKDDGIFISQDKYIAETLRKFGLTYGKSASTPIDNEKPLLKDPDGEDTDVHICKDYSNTITSYPFRSKNKER
nr:putative ribonuclease H-like domain-containing protein [Tanacetum cinerariifolium]